ncbi:hypothetical protein [Alkaliphilus peptidifermentans]|uniref:DUF3899 domain-containing protein n=1 Tax=Alkaliphilus peptidifermentans DSM 18978 TaxID=1120976 RepID=A0A1G5HTJ5_9FIRM|nr:hypothetical protein [Alkaliphilus peptidifermentans]SCY66610.1 hypothetical protein SAMN03080606_02110 [Alkaliphilus peptidifermentans DSM 18978]
MLNRILTSIKKTLKLSFASVVVISLVGLLYSLVRGQNHWNVVFNLNIIFASFIIVFGLFSFFTPINLRKTTRLVDHSNVTEVLKEEKDKKASGSIENIIWGISNIVIIGIIEVLMKTYYL